MVKKRGLGKGLGALIPDIGNGALEKKDGLLEVSIHEVKTNPFQPRKIFSEQEIQDLAASINEQGILQPLLVSRNSSGYELIAGERRLRAALKAGLEKVPVIIKDVDDRARQEIALIENIQRQDLNVLEEAEAYQSLIERFDYTQEEVARKVGKSRSVVTNALRILKLPISVKEDLLENTISMGHARAYLGIDKTAVQEEVHRRVVTQGLSVRQTENLINKLKNDKKGKHEKKKTREESSAQDAYILDELKKRFATKVDIVQKGDKGKIIIEFYSGEEFDRIYDLLRG